MHRYDAGRTLPILHASGVTTPQLAALEFVCTPRTVSAVADHLGLSRPATSQMVQKLVRRGFIRRSEGAVDRRERALVLSAQGKTLLATIAAARVARFEASLAALPSAVANRLRVAVSAATEALQGAPFASADSEPERRSNP